METRTWKVGQLSKLTGITIRALHHYDEIDLLSPMSHTDSGHRLYSELDIIKLQQIISLKQLGFSLVEIKEMFSSAIYNPLEVIKMQLERLDEEIKIKEELRSQLQELKVVFDTWRKPSPEQFINAIQLIINQSKYFTQEQRIKLKKQYDNLNATNIQESSNNWNQLISSLQCEMEKGTSPDSLIVMKLAKEWKVGIDLFSGGDKGLITSAERYYKDNPHAAKGTGMSGELYEYITKALVKL
jgi:DNA-binding transcriptional MerR regulator